MKKAEIIFMTIGVVATFLYLFAIPGMAFMAMASLASLLAIYFYFGFALFNEIRLGKIFWRKNYKQKTDYFLKIIQRCVFYLIFGVIVLSLPDVKEFRKQYDSQSEQVVTTTSKE